MLVTIPFVAVVNSNFQIRGKIMIFGRTDMMVLSLLYLRRVWVVEGGINAGIAHAAGAEVGTIDTFFIQVNNTIPMICVGLAVRLTT